MAKISKHYRVGPQTLEQLEKIQKHLQDRFDTSSDSVGVLPVKANSTLALEFAINYCYEQLKREGYQL